jgi:hypothetical protein
VDADLLVSKPRPQSPGLRHEVKGAVCFTSQQKYGIQLLGPVLSNNSWQAKAGKGFDVLSCML